jgi:hypothetical protein
VLQLSLQQVHLAFSNFIDPLMSLSQFVPNFFGHFNIADFVEFLGKKELVMTLTAYALWK